MKLKNLLSFSFLYVFVAMVTLSAQDRTTLYVDGNYTGGSSDGSESAPFTTIRAALDYRGNTLGLSNMESDERILVKSGNYAPDSTEMIFLTGTNGGKDNYWFTLEAEDSVYLDGSNLYNKKFAALIAVTAGAKNVRVKGFKLYGMRNNQSLADTVDGVYVKDGKFGIQVANTATNVEIVGNEIYDFSWTINVDPMDGRLGFSGADITEIKSADPGDNSGAINVVGTDTIPITGLVIRNNYVHHVIPGWTEGIQVNGNVDGFEISNNIIEEVQNIGIVAAGHYNWVTEIQGATVTAADNYARNGVIRNNKVTSCRSPIAAAAGIYCDGSYNVLIENNETSDGQVGFSIGNENSNVSSGGHTLRNNITYDNAWTGIIAGVPYAASGSTIDSVTITGNTVFRNGGVADTYLGNMGASELIVLKQIKNLTIENNIVYAADHDKLVTFALPFDSTSFIGTISFDYNIYYTNSTATPALGVFDWSQLGAGYDYYGTFAWYRTNRTNQDANSSFADPQFESTATGDVDLRLQSGSAAIDAGDPGYSVAAGETDFFGNDRIANSVLDAGAFESSSSAAGDEAATIDGIKSTSENYVTLQTGVTEGVFSSIYGYEDNNFVYVYAEYSGSMAEYSVFVNTNGSTGYQEVWTDKSDYYVDGNLDLFNYYTGTGSWPFDADNSVMTVKFIKTDSTIEGRIPKYALGIGETGTIGLGIEGYSTNWASSVGSIPVEDDPMVYLTLDGGSEAGSFSIDGIKSPVEDYAALITGVSGSAFSNMYGFVDAEYIYVYAEIANDSLREYDVYVNTNSSTGEAYFWTDKSNYYIDGNYNQLNEYTGSGGWPFEESTNSTGIEFVMTPTAVEGKILKSLIGVGSSGTIGLGIEGHTKGWNTSLGGAPTSGNSMVYLSLAYSGSRVATQSGEVEIEASIPTVAVYPNPVVETLSIQHFMESEGAVELSIHGVDGKLYHQWSGVLTSGNHVQKIAADKLPKGMAIVRFMVNGEINTHKIFIK
ncbi:choice-of-anchor Q domain-containing protein [Marinoscillum sp.]|uniref:choice-of-anchor Q domain-containing protein n=1 Tax=Marinoscillum sp. TaxID=2024838 RepID=UPI003BACE7C4